MRRYVCSKVLWAIVGVMVFGASPAASRVVVIDNFDTGPFELRSPDTTAQQAGEMIGGSRIVVVFRRGGDALAQLVEGQSVLRFERRNAPLGALQLYYGDGAVGDLTQPPMNLRLAGLTDLVVTLTEVAGEVTVSPRFGGVPDRPSSRRITEPGSAVFGLEEFFPDGLPEEVDSMRFVISARDTEGSFAVDSIVFIPEPGVLGVFGVGGVMGLRRGHRRDRAGHVWRPGLREAQTAA